MRIFNDSKDAFHFYTNSYKNKVKINQNINRALNYLMIRDNYSLFDILVQKKYYKYHYDKIINCLIQDNYYSFRLLKSNEINLSKFEINKIINKCLMDFSDALTLLSDYSCLLNNKQRKGCINSITLSNPTLIKAIIKKLFTEDEMFDIINKIDNGKYSVYSTIIVTDKYNIIDNIRQICFDYLVNNNYKDKLYSLAHKQLNEIEVELIYDKFGQYYYDKKKYHFESYLDFCKVFNGLLSTHEQLLLCNKLKNDKYKQYVSNVFNTIDFDKKFKEKIQSILVANKLSK
ncbi:MAG: hypothetical protein ACOCP8_01730 [archaeon]